MIPVGRWTVADLALSSSLHTEASEDELTDLVANDGAAGLPMIIHRVTEMSTN